MKYKNLIGKILWTGFNDTATNCCLLIDITPTEKTVEGRGKLYECKVDWEIRVHGILSLIDFDEQTLDELEKNGVSFNTVPYYQNVLFYRVSKTKTKIIRGEYFVIQNSKEPNQFLKPHPLGIEKEYVWGDGLIGSAGFREPDAIHASKNCTPAGNIIPMDSIAPQVKE